MAAERDPPFDPAEVLIAGAGIGGLALAIGLGRLGVPVRVFERAPALREVGAGVSLWPNAMHALRLLELGDRVRGEHVPLESITLRRRDGGVLMRLTDPGGYADPGICVHRAHLQRVLAREVPGERIHLDKRLVGFTIQADGVRATFHDGTVARGRLLVGCDGIHSAVRGQLHEDGPPRYRGYEIWRGMSRFSLPEELLQGSSEWWAPGRRFGILPGEAGVVYWYATRSTGDRREADGLGLSRLRAGFGEWPFPVPDLIEAAAAGDVVRTDAEDRAVPRRWGSGPVTLLGDAAHPMTPNMGQGACTAIEDAVMLARCVATHGTGARALRRYERARAPRTRWIVRQSRRIGRVAQTTNPLLAALRDGAMGLMPAWVLAVPQRRIYGYRAEPGSA